MIALLMAAQLAAAAQPQLIQPRLFQQSAAPACKSNGKVEASAPVDPAIASRADARSRITNLADLPKPNKEKAVLRAIDGCANPLVVQFNVGP